MNLIALTGLPRCGKDTFANCLRNNYGYNKLSFAGPLKDAAAILLNRPRGDMDAEDRDFIMPEWGFSIRYFLQRFGTECLREQIDQQFWVKRMHNAILQVRKFDPALPIVISDLRFNNEALLVKEFDGIIIDIKRPSCTSSDHASDRGISKEYIDYTMFNNEGYDSYLTAIRGMLNTIETQTKKSPLV